MKIRESLKQMALYMPPQKYYFMRKISKKPAQKLRDYAELSGNSPD